MIRHAARALRRSTLRPTMASAACTRGMDWISLSGKVTTDAAKSEVSRLRDLHSDLANHAKNMSAEPAPIDFNHYRNIIKSPGVVDSIEKSYNALSLPTYVNEVAGEAAATFDKLVAEAEESMTSSAQRLAELEELVAAAKENRTDENTTIDEVLARHPEIAAEIDQEIKEDKWYA